MSKAVRNGVVYVFCSHINTGLKHLTSIWNAFEYGYLFILYSFQAGALVHVYTDGSVLVTHGGTEMGQGLHTKMVQVSEKMETKEMQGMLGHG